MTENLNDNRNRGWFKKGRSGNSGGRPRKEEKGTTDVGKVLCDELQKEIQLVEGGWQTCDDDGNTIPYGPKKEA
jgi:hypothetical protein